MTKFNIGDIITDSMFEYTVVDVILDARDVIGNWTGNIQTMKLSFCYLLLDNKNKFNYFSEIKYENDYNLVKRPDGLPSSHKQTVAKENSCQQCNGELVEKFSEWAGCKIRKCSNCGWC